MLFNNCRSRPHAELYGPEAFYDLSRDGRQANMAINLKPGQHCCVATPVENNYIMFGWFCFSYEQTMEMPDKPGTTVRVFFGEWLGSERLSRTEAIATKTRPYADFFNIKGHFKQWSAIRSKGHCTAPASLCRS